MGNAAIQVDFLMAGFIDASGNPLAAGKVDTFEAGTTTPKQTFVESDKSVVESNPIILDGLGRKLVFADGNYKFVVKDKDDNVIITFDNLEYGLISVVLPEVSAPPGIAGSGQFTTFQTSGRTEARYTDDIGQDTQISKNGKLNAIAGPGVVIDKRLMVFLGTTGLSVQAVPITIDANGIITNTGISATLSLTNTGFPSGAAGVGKYSAKDVGAGVIEALYTDAAGNNAQLTDDGALKIFGTLDTTRLPDVVQLNEATHGLIMVRGGFAAAWKVQADSGNPPSVVSHEVITSGTDVGSSTTPVRKGENWRVVLLAGTVTIHFRPIG